MQAYSKVAYSAAPEKWKAKKRAYSKAAYAATPDKFKARVQAYSKAAYSAAPEKWKAKKRAYSKAAYAATADKFKARVPIQAVLVHNERNITHNAGSSVSPRHYALPDIRGQSSVERLYPWIYAHQ